VSRVRLAASPATPLTESLPRLESLVSRYTGIVRELHTVLVAPDDARLVKVAATSPAAAVLSEAERGVLDDGAGGYAPSTERARAAAIGEAAERYAGSFLPVRSLVLATAKDIGPAAVDPDRFVLFAPQQYARAGFPFVPFTCESALRWVRAFAVPDGAEAFVPAQLAYLSWRRTRADEARIGYSTSSGLACGPTLEEALLAGLFEVVERDAFMLTWHNRLSLRRIDWSGDPSLAGFEERYLAHAGARCSVVDLSGFLGVPTALAVVEGDGEREAAVAVGAGSSATIQEALVKAVAEAYAVRSWGRGLLRTQPSRPFAADFSDVVTFADHISVYARREHARRARFVTASPSFVPTSAVRPLPGTTPLEQIRAIAEALARQGAQAFGVDMTTPDLADAGLAVAKVVVPELCPLDVRHDARFLGGRRRLRLPFELGLRERPLAWTDINPDPHPFP
jgi:ribosomal protein S12 methylthiotransferase accessory factor